VLTNGRYKQAEKRALDKQLRDETALERRLRKEREQLQEQLSSVSEVWAPVGPFEYVPCEIIRVDATRIVLVRKDNREIIEKTLDVLLPEDPGTVEPPKNLVDLAHVHAPSLMEALRAKVGNGERSVLCGPNVVTLCEGGPLLEKTTEDEVLYSEILTNIQEIRTRVSEDQCGRVFICVGTAGSGKSKTSSMILDKLVMGHCTDALASKYKAAMCILNAFGTSVSPRSAKCSRFGCLYEVQMDQVVAEDTGKSLDSQVVGLALTTFGLESGQMTFQRKGEQSFNVFYQLCAHGDSTGMEQYRLRGAENYHYLNQGGVDPDLNTYPEHDFVELQGALEALGFKQSECQRIWGVLAAIVHLGQLEFKRSDNGQVYAEPSATVRVIASLLKLEHAHNLADVFTSIGDPKNAKNMGSRHKPEAKVGAARDAFARVLYERVFSWLVSRINIALCSEDSQAIVSVLDVPGGITADASNPGAFSLLCRNYVHERFVHFYNTIMFTNHAKELREEGVVPLTELDSPDNTDRLKLLENRGGIFSIIDEVAALPQAKADMLLQTLQTKCTGNENFVTTVATPGSNELKTNRTITIRHSFGDVCYDTRHFLDDDGDDSFSPALQGIQSTKCDLLRQLFPTLLGPNPELFASAAVVSRAAMVKAQVASIRQVLTGPTFIQPTFVHCVSLFPHGPVPGEIMANDHVQAQLDAYHVLNSIMWQRFGYPIPFPVEEFWDRFYMLTGVRDFPETRLGCADVLSKQPFEKHHWQIGRSMVFLRPKPLAILEESRQEIMQAAASCIGARIKRQRIFRWMNERKRAMAALQPILRGILTRQLYNRALEIAFMAFSERESDTYAKELAHETAREQMELGMMAEQEAQCQEAWAIIEADANIEDEHLCNMWAEDELAQAIRAVRRLQDVEDTYKPNQPQHAEAHQSIEIHDPLDPTHMIETFDFAQMSEEIMNEVTREVKEVMSSEVEHADEEHNRLMEEQNRESIARQRMKNEQEYLTAVREQRAQRKEMGMVWEQAMMEVNENETKVLDLIQSFAVMTEGIRQAEEDASTPEAVQERLEKVDKAVEKMRQTGDQIVKDAAEKSDTELQASDSQLNKKFGAMIVSSEVLDMIDKAVEVAVVQAKTRESIETSEVRRSQIEKQRAARELQMEKERLARQKKRLEEEAKLLDEDEETRKKEEAAAAAARERKARADAINALNKEPEEEEEEHLPERIAQFRQERRQRQGDEEVVNLQRWNNIEDELSQMMDLLKEPGEGTDMAYEMALKDDEKYDFKYMYKYKYRALVLDDDQELPSLGPGEAGDRSP